MIQIAEVLPARPTPLWKLVQQVGVTHAVGPVPYRDEGTERPWELAPMRRMKERFDEAGFTLSVIESSPPMDLLRLGRPGREEELEWFQTLLQSMGTLDIPVLCYNWMAVLGWMRTSAILEGRAGALVTGFDLADIADAPLTQAGEVPESQLWESLHWFLERVVPVAESAGVKLAMHPDDPPLSPVRGLGRIMRSVENFQRLLDLVPSPVNGLTLCQGNFTLMTDDLPGVIRHFGGQGKIHFVHFRDVRGTPEKFVEVFHDEGPTDMMACMRAYRDIGFEGVLRPDHVPTLEGDSNDNPCYSSMARLHAIGYIQGLREAAWGKHTPAA
jgi:mannonate dehydratase